MKTVLMNRVCYVFLIALAGIVAHLEQSGAVPAYPGIITLTQPDGTTFSARLFNGGVVETEDGYSIIQNQQGYWSYVVLDTICKPVPSPMIVGKDDPVALGLPKHISPVPELVQRVCGSHQTPEQLRRLMRTPEQPGRAVLQTRILSVPVLLMTFADTIPSTPPERFSTLLSDSNDNALKAYYQAVMEEAFRVSVEPGGVTVWYHSSYLHDFYGQDFPGSNGQPGDDYLAATLVSQAVKEADRSVNFADYDLDRDCYVDMVLVVHQGTGQEESHNPNDIWSHRWTLNDAMRIGDGAGEITTRDPCNARPDQAKWMKVNAYTIVPEIIL